MDQINQKADLKNPADLVKRRAYSTPSFTLVSLSSSKPRSNLSDGPTTDGPNYS